MSAETQLSYPGETSTPRNLLLLAAEYKHAAEVLFDHRKKGSAMATAPFRLVAIHAIELYLNALLIAGGANPVAIRGLQHDLAERAILASENKLDLRQNTRIHLQQLCEYREYICTRYQPEAPGRSQLNRINATLAEISKKVVALIGEIPAATEGKTLPPTP